MSMISHGGVELETEAKCDNEYLKEFRLLQESHWYKGQQWFGHRQELVEKYGWAVPNGDVIDYISNAFSEIAEIGAGEGYWAKVLSENSVKVHAFDKESDSKWYDVREKALCEVTDYVSDNPVMMVWPPLDDSMAADVLRCEPSHVLYVGETRGGCTASDEFFDMFTDLYHPVEKIELPSYVGVNDNFYHAVRKI